MQIALDAHLITYALIALLVFSHATMFLFGYGLAHSQMIKARMALVNEAFNGLKRLFKPLMKEEKPLKTASKKPEPTTKNKKG